MEYKNQTENRAFQEMLHLQGEVCGGYEAFYRGESSGWGDHLQCLWREAG